MYTRGEDEDEIYDGGCPSSSVSTADLLARTTKFVQQHMAAHDGSHDFSHIERVLALAHQIAASESLSLSDPPYNSTLITLACLLHDVDDRKYATPNASRDQARAFLLSAGAARALADAVQAVCHAVSYSAEVADPSLVRDVLARYPELGPVQDADRLDALGAVGLARCFAFGGARNRGLGDGMAHVRTKLEKLEGTMKTGAGREMARARMERVRVFVGWWADEAERGELR